MNLPGISSIRTSYQAYRELLYTGSLMSVAENNQIDIRLTGYVTGDILVWIAPKNRNQDELIQQLADAEVTHKTREQAVKGLRQKFDSLGVIPGLILLIINLIPVFLYYKLLFIHFWIFLTTNIQISRLPEIILGVLPSLILPVLTYIFRHGIGSAIMRFIFRFFFRGNKLKRKNSIEVKAD